MDKTYHKLMSEIYFTRAMIWLISAAVVHEICEHPLDNVLGAFTAIIAISYFALSIREDRRAR